MEAAGFGVESLEMEAIRNEDEDEDENHRFGLVRGTGDLQSTSHGEWGRWKASRNSSCELYKFS